MSLATTGEGREIRHKGHQRALDFLKQPSHRVECLAAALPDKKRLDQDRMRCVAFSRTELIKRDTGPYKKFLPTQMCTKPTPTIKKKAAQHAMDLQKTVEGLKRSGIMSFGGISDKLKRLAGANGNSPPSRACSMPS